MAITLERTTREKAVTTKVRQEVLVKRGGDLEGLLRVRVRDPVGKRRECKPGCCPRDLEGPIPGGRDH